MPIKFSEPDRKDAVALARCGTYAQPLLRDTLCGILAASRLPVSSGMRILVKPNLLMGRPLACANPEVVAGVCRWLLDMGARVTVADSPGFGRPGAVAKTIGLAAALEPLGLKVRHFGRITRIKTIVDTKPVSIPVASLALESDMIFSLAKVKAHSQMRMTLSVKNCFGCVPGLRKAFFHARYGADHDFFARCLMSLWQALPPVAGVADGITAMHVTGPSKGEPFSLGLLGASADAAALDEAILAVLGIDRNSVPLACAIRRARAENARENFYPLAKPDDFDAAGFEIPAYLKPATFNPARLAQSCLRRIWSLWKGGGSHS